MPPLTTAYLSIAFPSGGVASVGDESDLTVSRVGWSRNSSQPDPPGEPFVPSETLFERSCTETT